MRLARFPIAVVLIATMAFALGGCSKKSHSEGVVSLDSTTTAPAGGSGGGSGAGSTGTTATSTTSAGGGTANGTTITIKNFAFDPAALEAKVGVTITVSNTDATIHTLTADDHSLDTGNIEAGASKTIVVNKAGDLTYHCNIHDYMKGVIHVSP